MQKYHPVSLLNKLDQNCPKTILATSQIHTVPWSEKKISITVMPGNINKVDCFNIVDQIITSYMDYKHYSNIYLKNI